MDYKIVPVVSKSGRRTRYAISKEDRYLVTYRFGDSANWWGSEEDMDEDRFLEYVFFRSRRAAYKEAERVDRLEFQQAKDKDLQRWNLLVKDYS